jgi:hypothetical protein
MPQPYPISAIAQLIKLSERRIYQLVKDGVLPRPIKGEYDAIGCVHAYIDYLRKAIAGNGELSLTEERTRYTKYQADLAQIELKKGLGQLLKTDVAMQHWEKIVIAAKQRLLGLSTRLAPLVATTQSIPEIKERIDNAIYEVLNEFANPDLSAIARTESHTTSLDPIPTPTKTNRKRVGGQKKTTKPGK